MDTPDLPLYLACPKCAATMYRRDYDAGAAYRCNGCEGLWFPMLEHEALRTDADVIDVGCDMAGTRFNTVDRIQCPACSHEAPLVRMVDAEQPHIWYESCKTCYGHFFDAGEFRDLAEFTVEDFVKRFSAKPRF